MTSFLLIFILLVIVCGIGVIVGLKLNRETYHEGKLVIKRSEDGKQVFSLEMDEDPYKLKDLDIITFKVVDEEFDE
jgi:hypothetical protein